MEDEYNQDCFDWFSDMSEAWPENSCHTKTSSYQKENSIDGNSFFSGSYFHSNNNSSDRSDPSNWREWKQSSVLKPAQGVKRRIGVNANIEEQSFYEKEDKDRPILHPFSSTNPHQRVILDWLSEREERKVYQNIRNSVHKEKMLEYEPILSRLVEKQYLLMKQAMSLGLTTNPVLALVPFSKAPEILDAIP
ncbi:uncharacterized protein LOC111700539 isoform X2 [Eurytemora carolleeae]|uniref:uncharacterized protein LOC111700539 isoform X2 n=1 Tax=Eurytemora carolleeae TaxID=1294199 RepID=UPI000C78B5FB|nr:uncharacterized protein LOC111700539 isoform X2 [Eurytemora carolleeae]|eukprot:XP_023327263.1 uncharacterized protein LOC111700539 isoform X2 [Eurytemora affinis]